MTLSLLWQYLLHIDLYLVNFISAYGLLTYLLLFAIIFCETGLIILPFLPGDSLLFTTGSIAAHPNHPLDITVLFVLLTLASILGNKLNYLIGRAVGPKIFSAQTSWLLNTRHIKEAHDFYEENGGKTLIFARFIPIIRTFAPFVAGVANMSLQRFSFFNISSALLWIGALLGGGYFFGALPLVQAHFTTVIYGIILISLLPAIYAYLHRKLSTSG